MKSNRKILTLKLDASNKTINPNRLILARERRNLTKKKLAELVGKTSRSITAWESEAGSFNPAQDSIELLAEKLDFPVEFFYGEDLERINSESASFRALSKMTAGLRDSALAAGDIGVYLNEWIEQHFELPNSCLPDLRYETPESAATNLRQEWILGKRPISNLIHLLEAKGVRIFAINKCCAEIDAFSFWRNGTPYIFLNLDKTAERTRFDLAHELGHLVMHAHGAPTGQDAEREADEFASAFLMPSESLLPLNSAAVFQNLVKAKHHWKVSMLALVVRLHKIGYLSEWKYRSLCIHIREKFGKEEPHPLQPEKSQILNKVFKALWSEGVSADRIARTLALPVNEIKALAFGLIADAAESSNLEENQLSLVR